MARPLAIPLFLIVALISRQVHLLETCSNSDASLYDGYLEPFIYFASFDEEQNGYLNIPNPFQAVETLDSITITFWAKFPSITEANYESLGTLVDCGDTALITIQSGVVTFLISEDETTTNYQTASLDGTFEPFSIDQMGEWQSMAFSFSSNTQYFFVNGANYNQVLALETLGQNSAQCSIANSLEASSPLSVYLRHLMFTTTGWTTATDYSNLLHHQLMPSTDSNLLAYYAFDSFSELSNTYYYLGEDTESEGAVLMNSAESEFVCYCTGTYPNFLQVDDSFTFAPITELSATIGSEGYILEFQIFAFLPTIDLPTILLFSLQDYSDIYLTNNGENIRVDLFEEGDISTASRSVTFPRFTFRYNIWTDIRISVSTSSVTLTVDGLQINSYSHSVDLPEEVSEFSISNNADLNFLISYVTLTQGGSRGAEAVDQQFDQDTFSSVEATWVETGTPTFTTNNRQCSYSIQSQQTFWNGLSCEDNRLYPYFDGSSASGLVSGSLQSSSATMTIEMWVMDNNNDASTMQVLFENSADDENPLVQIALLTGSDVGDGKSIYCYPSRTSSAGSMAELESQQTFSVWTHLACISDGDAMTTTLLSYSDETSTSNSVAFSGLAFQEVEGEIMTSLASSVAGGSRFSGFIREVRIWTEVRSEQDITLFRYLAIGIDTPNLVYYFKLSDQINPLELTDSVGGATLTEQQDPVMISFIEDTLTDDLIVCQAGLSYNLQCCEPFDISSIRFNMAYDGTYIIDVGLDESSLSNPGLYQSMVADFQITGVGDDIWAVNNDPTITYLNYLGPQFNKIGVQEYTVNPVLIDTNIGSVTVTATAYSLYDTTQTISLSRTLSIRCPVTFLTIIPGIGSDSAQIVSLITTDSQPVINMITDGTCAGVSNIDYTVSIEDPDDLRFRRLYSTSSTTITSQSDKVSELGSNSITVTLLVTAVDNDRDNAEVSQQEIILQYEPVEILYIYDESELTQTLEWGDLLTMDFSSSSSSDTEYTLLFEVTCPSSMFSTTNPYSEYCVMDSDGIFSLDTAVLDVIADYPYTFTFRLILEGTAIFYDYEATIDFYKDGGSSDCPKVELESTYNLPFALQNTYELYPDLFFYCNGQPFQLNEASWLLVDSLDGTDFSYILNFDSQTIPRYANILPSSLGNIVSGQILDLTVQFRAISDDEISQVTTSSFGQIAFAQSAIVVDIEMSNGRSTITDNTLPFVSEFLILDVSDSYDPNDASATLSYTWTCPVVITSSGYTCDSFVSGDSNQLLQIDLYDRINIGFVYSTEYQFIVQAESLSNPYKTTSSQVISVYFSPPESDDSSNNLDMQLTCSSLNAENGYLTSVEGISNTMAYDIANYAEANFDVTTTFSSSCSVGTPTTQQMYIYVFGAFFDSTTPLLMLFEQEEGGVIQLDTENNFVMEDYFDLLSLEYEDFYQANIYLLTRVTDTDDTYLDIETVYFYRQPAQLVAQLSEASISVDKYNNFELDASTSFDPEEMFTSYSYIWTCPNSVSCSDQTSEILSVTYLMRENGNANTASTSYTYSVAMTDGDRVSDPATVTVTITQEDNYEDCLTLTLNTDDLVGYDSTDEILYLQYNQEDPESLQMTIVPLCDNVNIQDQTFTTEDTTQASFWETDVSDSSYITFTSTSLGILEPNEAQVIIFTQDYSLGLDTDSPFSATYEITVMMSEPDLVIDIADNRILYFATSTSTITIDASGTNDPMGDPLVYIWDCPSYFGGDGCSTSDSVVLSYSSLAAANGNDVEQFYDQSHLFTFTVTTFEGLREETQDFYLYLVDPGDTLLTQTGASSCGIYISGSSDEKYISFDTSTSFIFDCPSDASVTTSITDDNTLTWTINGLTENVDYFQVDGELYLGAFSATQLGGVEELVISLDISNVLSNTLQQAFKIKSTQLNYQQGTAGDESITVSPSTSVSYSQAYDFTFSNFASTRSYGIQTQLRGYSTALNSQLILYPMAPYTDQVNGELYTELVLPNIQSLYVDFFDMNADYMGSFDLGTQSFGDMTQGEMTMEQFELNWSPLMDQAALYTDGTSEDQHQYIYDTRLLLTYTEAMLSLAISDASASDLQAYSLQAITFLTQTLSNELAYFSTGGTFFQSKGRLFLLKSAIYTLDMATQTGVEFSEQINEVLAILEMALAGYDDLQADGRDQDTFDQSMLAVIDSAQVQVDFLILEEGESITNQQYQLRIDSLLQTLVGDNFDGLVEGETSQSFEGTTSESYHYLDTSTSATSVSLSSLLNSNEAVQLESPSELTSRGAAYLQASFSMIEDADFASSTTVYIDAFDENFGKVDIEFETLAQRRPISSPLTYILDSYTLGQENTYLTFSLQAKQEFMTLFTDTLNDASLETYYYPSCNYFDKSQNLWSAEGVTNSSYDYDTGVLMCSTNHLSQFGMGSVLLTKSLDGGSGTSYFQQTDNVLIYGIVCGAATVLTLCAILLSCLTKTNWDAKSPNLTHLRHLNNGCCGACKSAFLLHHLMFSAIIGPSVASIHLTVPKIHKMIDLWWLFYAILAAIGLTMWLKDDIDWAEPYQTFDITDTSEIMDQFQYYKPNLILIASIVGAIWIGRIVVLTVGYTLYFMGKGPEMNLKMKENTRTASVPSTIGHQSVPHTSVVSSEIHSDLQSDLEENLVKKKAKKGKKKKKKRVVKKKKESDQEFEGGSSEDDSLKKKGKKQTKASDPAMRKKHRYDNNSGSDHTPEITDQMRRGSPTKHTKKNDQVAADPAKKKKVYNKNTENEGKHSSNEDDKGFHQRKSNSPAKAGQKNVNKQDLFVDDQQYMRMNQDLKPKAKKQDNMPPTKKQFQNEPIVEEMKEEKKKKKKKRIVKKSRSPSPARDQNMRIQNMSTLESGQEFSANEDGLPDRKKRAMGKSVAKPVLEVDEEHVIGEYKGGKMMTLGIKITFLLGCMAISYWMLWLFEDLSYIYSWLGMTAAVLVIWMLVLQPLFILIFALFFICTKGNGVCIKVTGIILMGNAHHNLVNGILYDMNNNI